VPFGNPAEGVADIGFGVTGRGGGGFDAAATGGGGVGFGGAAGGASAFPEKVRCTRSFKRRRIPKGVIGRIVHRAVLGARDCQGAPFGAPSPP
jgi:hypothetical protein